MAALGELAEGYRAAAIQLRVAIEDAKERMEQAGPRERAVLARDIRVMEGMLRETRDLRRLCEGYYHRDRDGRYTTATLRAPRRDALK